MMEANEMKDKIFFKTAPIDDDLDLLAMLLGIYAVTNRDMQALRPQERYLMVFYLKYGYSNETIDMFIEHSSKDKTHVRVINTSLRGKGYIDKDRMNTTKSFLSKDMEELRDVFLNKGVRNYLIKFDG